MGVSSLHMASTSSATALTRRAAAGGAQTPAHSRVAAPPATLCSFSHGRRAQVGAQMLAALSRRAQKKAAHSHSPMRSVAIRAHMHDGQENQQGEHSEQQQQQPKQQHHQQQQHRQQLSSASSPILVLALSAAAATAIRSLVQRLAQHVGAFFGPLRPHEASVLRAWGLAGRAGGLQSSAAAPLGLTSSLFFASVSQSSYGGGGGANTPLTVIASGMAKWLELYSGLLLIRVLLSWFPNIDWERQPMQAIRDMSDPYLNLFRNIMPPFFGALDLSPLLAFLVLGMLTSLLNTTVFA